MLRSSRTLVTISMVALFALGCAGGNQVIVTPQDNPEIPITTFENEASINNPSDHVFWGIWDIHFDTDELRVTVEPVRDMEMHINITNMITSPLCNDCIGIHVNSFDPLTRILDVDVTLRNKYLMTGCDVRGILFTNDCGHKLVNADDWTGLWDVPGGQTINPFKAFAKDNNRKFLGLSEHTENYRINIPKPTQWGAITYAVDASWPGHCSEPYEITNYIQDNLYDALGSMGQIYVDVCDWQNDVSKVTLVAPEITGEDFTQFSHISGDTWETTLVNNMGAVPGIYEGRIIASSASSGSTALYDYIDITIIKGGWARTWGGTYNTSGWDIAIDGSGNSYTCGIFYGTVDFDPGPEEDKQTASGQFDVFLSKFDSAGNFQLALTWGGSNYDRSYRVAVDGSDNVYITGCFNETVDFDPGVGEDMHTASPGYYDVFLSKFDSTGVFQWARTWGGFEDDEGYGVDIDGTGDAYITGYFNGNVDFDPGVGEDEHISNGANDAFLSKVDLWGFFHWARTWGGFEDDRGYGVAIDGNGNAYITGFFGGTVDFDPGSGVDEYTSIGSLDVFLTKLRPHGYW